MENVARRHHTVPRFYLKGFANQGRIGTVELPGTKRFTQSIERAATHNNFYAVSVVDGGPTDAFEKVLSVLETEAARIFRSVLDEDEWPLNLESRQLLAEFAAVQYLRGPNQRRQIDDIAAAMTKMQLGMGGRDSVYAYAKERMGREITEEEADQLWADVISEDGPPIRHTPKVHVEQILNALPEIWPYFMGRPWTLIRFSRRSLVMCDTPLALVPAAGQSPYEGVGLINAWGITMPLSRNVGLLMADPGPILEHVVFDDVASGRFDMRQPPSATYANMFNDATIRNARRWIFHHPHDGHLIGSDLPEPRDREMEISGTNDFVGMGERMRATGTSPTHRLQDGL